MPTWNPPPQKARPFDPGAKAIVPSEAATPGEKKNGLRVRFVTAAVGPKASERRSLTRYETIGAKSSPPRLE